MNGEQIEERRIEGFKLKGGGVVKYIETPDGRFPLKGLKKPKVNTVYVTWEVFGRMFLGDRFEEVIYA